MSEELDDQWVNLPFDEETDQVDFFSEDIDFEISTPESIASWIKQIITQEAKQLQQLSFIFCNDEYLHKINVEYLDHDTYTDIITFPYAEPPLIKGDLFISIERVKENATKLNVPFEQELFRVIIHGVLHLCGYGDKSEEQKIEMRKKENAALELLKKL